MPGDCQEAVALVLAFACVNLGENILKAPCILPYTCQCLLQINKIQKEEKQYSVFLIITIRHAHCR